MFIKKYLMITAFCIMAPLYITNTVEAATVTTKAVAVSAVKTSYKNLGMSIADSYLNIRKTPSIQGEIVGKLYTGTVATLETTSGEWVKITSGDVKGYVSKKYLAIGKEAQKLFPKYANAVATVNTNSLRVRKSNSIKSKVLGLVSKGKKFQVISQGKKWTKIRYNGGTGYISNDYIKMSYTFEYAISIEEERENIKQELAAKEKEKNQGTSGSGSSNSGQSSSNSNSSSSTGKKVAAFAKKYLGYPYVWGGTSLTKGSDCSGFIQSVFKNFGISVPRTSREQALAGKKVSVKNIKVGDIVTYAKKGVVNHVALYVGDGLVIHASNPEDGVKLSKYNYRSIHSVRRVI